MGVYITGDIHGELSVSRLGSKSFPLGDELTKDDYVIVLGDFGLVWFPEGDKRSKGDCWWLDCKKWFFGHYHRTCPMTQRHWCICNAFFDLEQDAIHS